VTHDTVTRFYDLFALGAALQCTHTHTGREITMHEGNIEEENYGYVVFNKKGRVEGGRFSTARPPLYSRLLDRYLKTT
jgi:hypothetical protein